VIIFWIICGLLIALALAFVLPPLQHPDHISVAMTPTEANVAVYRRQLAEMESDRRHGIITNDQFVRDRDELEQRLVLDLGNDRAHEHNRRHRDIQIGSLYYWLAVGLPSAVVLLYLILGTPPVSP
jgi:cytochrome c-type biogenesis protein CcmH